MGRTPVSGRFIVRVVGDGVSRRPAIQDRRAGKTEIVLQRSQTARRALEGVAVFVNEDDAVIALSYYFQFREKSRLGFVFNRHKNHVQYAITAQGQSECIDMLGRWHAHNRGAVMHAVGRALIGVEGPWIDAAGWLAVGGIKDSFFLRSHG